jgi:hypothetical protein
MSNGKLKYFKTATIQERNNGFISNKLGKIRSIISNKYSVFWLILPKKIVRASGWKPSKIAEELGMSYTWVMKHISQKFKNESLSVVATRRVAETDVDFQNASSLDAGSVMPESTITEEEKPNLVYSAALTGTRTRLPMLSSSQSSFIPTFQRFFSIFKGGMETMNESPSFLNFTIISKRYL